MQRVNLILLYQSLSENIQQQFFLYFDIISRTGYGSSLHNRICSLESAYHAGNLIFKGFISFALVEHQVTL